MSAIEVILGKQITDSLGRPTVEVTVKTSEGEFTDSVPAGTSLGASEAKTVPPEYAIKLINETISPALKGMDPVGQDKIDNRLRELDGTLDKSRLGANSILPVSLAVARAGAASQGLQLYQWIAKLSGLKPIMPIPMMVMISGGEHGQNNNINVQEFMVVGKTADGQVTWAKMQDYLNAKGITWNLGPEGSFAPKDIDDNQAMDLLNNFRASFNLAIDVAASHRHSMIDMVNWISKYKLLSVEDPFGQEDWEVWQKFTADFGKDLLVVGDDLFTTNPQRVKRGIEEKAANAVIIKPNQIGTLSEVFEVAKLATQAGWTKIVSHRSGETTDDFIADLAVGIGANYLKSGAPYPLERKVKYDRLDKIAETLK